MAILRVPTMLRPTVRFVIGLAVVVSLAVGAAAGQGGGAGRAGGAGGRGGGQAPGGGRGGFAPAPRDATDQSAVGTAVLSGTVVTEGTGTPVRRARVNISAPELRGSRATLTDDQGRFSFLLLPAGRYTLNASKSGFVNIAYGAKQAGRQGTAVLLAEGQRADKLTISMPRGGVLTGSVVDEHGEPAASVSVRALRAVMQTGERTWQVVNQDTTDDRGVYRIFQLQPGDYLVNAVPRNANPGDDIRQVMAAEMATVAQFGASGELMSFVTATPGAGDIVAARISELQQQVAALEKQGATAYAPIYFPGTTAAASAQTIALNGGEERGGIDFRLQLVPTTRVNGMVTSATGALPPGTQVTLMPAGQGGAVASVGMNSARTDAQGHFSFNNVVPGDYMLHARAGGPGGGGRGRGGPGEQPTETLWATAELVVTGQPLPDIVLTLQTGMTVGGRVEFDGTNQDAFVPSNIRIGLVSRSQAIPVGGPASASTDDAGRFTITGVAPGRYTLSTMGRGGGGGRGGVVVNPGAQQGQLVAKSAMVSGTDLLDFPMDIGPNQNVSNVVVTYTDKTQELSGTIQDTAGGPTSDFTIIVFPSDKKYWMPQARRISATRPGTDGRFTFRGLPAGDYSLTAVTDVEPGEWFDPAFLEQLAGASIPISLSDGERKVQDIRLASN